MTAADTSASLEARFVELCRQASAILIASVVAGLVIGGVGSRTFMLVARVLAPERRGAITENGNVVGEVTFEGSFFLILFAGLFTAIAVGVLIAVTQTWLAGLDRWEGPVVGWLVLAVFSRAVIEPENFDFALLGDEAVTVAMIGVLGVAAGWAAVSLRNALLARLPLSGRIAGEGGAYLPGLILGVLGLVLVVGLMGATETPTGTTALDLVVGVSFGIAAIASIVDRIRWVAGSTPSWSLRWVGVAGVVGMVTAGSLRLLHDVTHLLA